MALSATHVPNILKLAADVVQSRESPGGSDIPSSANVPYTSAVMRKTARHVPDVNISPANDSPRILLSQMKKILHICGLCLKISAKKQKLHIKNDC